MKIWGVLFLSFVISNVYGTTFVPISLKEQVSKSDSMVHGTVVSKVYEPHDFFGAVTKIEVRPESVLGLPSAQTVVEVYYPGGELQQEKIAVPGAPEVQVGEKLVLILNDHKKGLWVSNLGLGKYSLKRVGDDWVMINQIFPDHPEIGHMKLSRFKKLAEKIKTNKFVMREKTKLEYEQKQVSSESANSRKIASVPSESNSRDDFPIVWLVFIFGALGLGMQLSKKKKS